MTELKDRMLTIVSNDRQMIAIENKYKNSIIPQNKNNTSDLAKFDSFISTISKLNSKDDRKKTYNFTADTRLSYEVRKSMMKDSPITRVIVNSIVKDSLKNEIVIDHDKKDDIIKVLNDLDIKNIFKRTAIESRMHGGAIAFFLINDGQPFESPVIPEKITEIKFISIANKDKVTPLSASIDNHLVPINYIQGSEHEFYKISKDDKEVIFHKSRCIVFNGEYCGEDNLKDNNGFYEDIPSLVSKDILLYEITGDSVSSLSDNAIQEILKVNGLQDLIKDDLDNAFEQIFAMMLGKGILGRMVVDKEDDYEYHSANFSGYKDIHEIAKDKLSASSRIPRTKLFGESPSSSIGSQSGNYEKDVWNEQVEDYQTDILKPNYNKVLNWVKALFNIPQDEVILFKFPNLYPMTPKEEVELRNIQASTDSTYIQAGVLKAETVALSRFEGEYTINTVIDDKLINEMKQTLLKPKDNNNQKKGNIQEQTQVLNNGNK